LGRFWSCAAWADRFQGRDDVTVCFFGDGSLYQGVLHESSNLAKLWKAPVVYFIENNQYSMGTSQDRSSAYPEGKCLAARAEGYNMVWDEIEGWDFYQLRAKTKEHMDAAREESRPALLEVNTYRCYGHSVADANTKKYRTPEEIDRFKNEFDPINLWQDQLLKEGVLTEEQAAEIDKEAKKEAADSGKFADESEFPSVEEITADVYWEVDEGTEAGRTGRHFFND